jgi:hypothetical protein
MYAAKDGKIRVSDVMAKYKSQYDFGYMPAYVAGDRVSAVVTSASPSGMTLALDHGPSFRVADHNLQ